MNTKHSPAAQGGAPGNSTDSETERRLKLLAAYQRNRLEPDAAKRAAKWWTGPLTADQILHPTQMTALEVLSKLEANGYPCAVARVKDGFSKDWNKRAVFGAHTEDGDYWRAKLQSIPGIKPTSIGLLCGPIWVVDNDCDDPVAAREVDKARIEILGSGKMQRIGNRDRVGGAVPYRATSAQRWNAINGERGSVETLAETKQIIGFGLHTSGLWYDWQGHSPLDIPLSELPAPSADDMNRFRDECAKILKANNYTKGAGLGGGIKHRKKGEGGGTGEITRNADGLVCDGRDRFAMELAHRLAWKQADASQGKVDPEQLYADLVAEFTAKAVRDDRWEGQSGDLLLRQKAFRQAAIVEAEWRKKSEVQWLDEADGRKPDYAPERLPLAAMEAKLKSVMEEFGITVMCRDVETPAGSVRQFYIQAGGGKSHEMREVLKALRDAGLRTMYLSQNHDLLNELAEKKRKDGLKAEVYGGFLAKVDPSDKSEGAERFCLRPEEAKLLIDAGISPNRGLCKSGSEEQGTLKLCPRHDQCQRKKMEAADPEVWVAATNFLVLPPFVDTLKVDLLVVDETPNVLFAAEEKFFTLRDLKKVHKVPFVKRSANGHKVARGISHDRTNDLHSFKIAIRDMVRGKEPGQYLTADDFAKWSLEKGDRRNVIEDIELAAELEADRGLLAKGITPDMSVDEVRRAASKSPKRVGDFGFMWKAIHTALNHPEGAGFARLAIVKGADGYPVLCVRMRPSLRPEWRQKPVALLDATPASDRALTEVLEREVTTVADIHAEVPDNVSIIQVLGAPTSKSKLGLAVGQQKVSPAKAAEKPTGHANSFGDLIRLLCSMADGDVGFVASLEIKELLLKIVGDEAKKKLKELHYGKTVGLDGLGDVDVMICIGAELPPPILMENAAEGVFGRFVQRMEAGTADWFYPLKAFVSETVDGRRFEHEWYYHPDEDVDELFQLACRAQFIQGMERSRIARRGERGNPCLVFAFTDLPLGYPVGKVLKWAEIEPNIHETMASHGFLTKSATLLHTILPDRFKSLEVAKKALQRAHEGDQSGVSGAADAADLGGVTNPGGTGQSLYIYKYRKCPRPLNFVTPLKTGVTDPSVRPGTLNWKPYSAQRAGPGQKPLEVAIDPKRDVADILHQAGFTMTATPALLSRQTGKQLGTARDPSADEIRPNLDPPESQIDLTPQLVRDAQSRRKISNGKLAEAIGWNRESLSRWLNGKRALPKAYRQPLTEWLNIDPPANFEHGAAQQAVDHGTFPATLADHLKDLPQQVARAMAERGTSNNELAKIIGVPFFVISAFIEGRTTLDPERTESLVAWLLDDAQPTFEQQLDALLEELLFPPPPEPIWVPSLFVDELHPIWPDALTGEYPGPLGLLVLPDSLIGVVPSIFAGVEP